MYFDAAVAHVRTPLFVVQQMPGVWDYQCLYDGRLRPYLECSNGTLNSAQHKGPRLGQLQGGGWGGGHIKTQNLLSNACVDLELAVKVEPCLVVQAGHFN